MANKKLVKLLLTSMLGILTISGLFPNQYTNSRTKFVPTKLYMAYSIFITIGFTTIYMSQIYWDYTHNEFDLRDAVKLYSYMNIIVSIINYVTQLFVTKTVANFMNNVPFFSFAQYFNVGGSTLTFSVFLVYLRAVLFPLVIEITLIIQQQHNHPERSLLWTAYILFPMVISNLLNNCFFGAISFARLLLTELNIRLKTLAKEVNLLQTAHQLKLQKPYYRMRRFCDLSDLLNELAVKYSITCSKAQDYMELMALSLICSLFCNLLGLTVGFFQQYHAIADTFINNEPYDALTALTNLVFLIISFLEIVSLAQLCNHMLIETKDAGYLLQTMTLQHADIRFKRAVQSFSLYVATIKYNIKPLGLFELRVSLINDVLSAVTSFLLILIQSDLTLRFSLK